MSEFELEVVQRLTKLETILKEHTRADEQLHQSVLNSLEIVHKDIGELKVKDAVLTTRLGLWGGLAGVISLIATLLVALL